MSGLEPLALFVLGVVILVGIAWLAPKALLAVVWLTGALGAWLADLSARRIDRYYDDKEDRP